MEQSFIAKLFDEKEYHDIVRNTILSLVPKINDADLEDCVMEVYLDALKKQKKLEKHPDIKGWLNLATKFVVKRFIKSRVADSMNTVDLIDEVEDPMRFEDLVDGSEFVKDLLNFIPKHLKSVERELFQLKCVERLPNDKIAEIMNFKRKTVDVKVTRLREKIRNIKEIFENL